MECDLKIFSSHAVVPEFGIKVSSIDFSIDIVLLKNLSEIENFLLQIS